MNYKKIHDQIIKRAKNRILEGYKENHHIVPKCMGGTNESDNVVELTAREHFIIHKLLHRIYPTHQGLWFAIWIMSTTKTSNDRDYKVSSRDYNRLKEQFAIKIRDVNKGRIVSDETRKKLSIANTGKIRSPEMRCKISEVQKGRILTDEHKRKISKSCMGINVGRKMTEEQIRKMVKAKTGCKYGPASDARKKAIGDANRGKKHTDETKQKLRDAWIRKPILECPHCDMKSKSHANMGRYHFDNCKQKV
jgi:hypothetical protein